MNKRILAIETSCDETALAVVEASGGLKSPRFRVLKNVVASQIKIHRPFGGVVPSLAKREHIKNLPVLLERVFGKTRTANSKWENIDLISVTVGPGLEPALWTGIEFAKNLAGEYKKILTGANHLEGHLYSFLLPEKNSKSKALNPKSIFPAVALIVSGGHTILLKMDSFVKWKKLGETRDDAVGEAFDKVARILDLPYPGGPEIEKLALRQAQGKHPNGTISFPRPMMHQKNYDFSFSGLKTSVLYYMRDANPQLHPNITTNRKSKIRGIRVNSYFSDRSRADVAASFQKAAIDVLKTKTFRAARETGAKSIILCGGVAANKALRKTLYEESKKLGLKFFVPDFKYNIDNAAMIAAAGYFARLRGKKYRLVAQGNLSV